MAISGADNSKENKQSFSQEQAQTQQNYAGSENYAPGYTPGSNPGSVSPTSIFDALARRQNIAVPEALKDAITQITSHLQDKFKDADVRCEQYPSVPSVYGWSILGRDGIRYVALVAFEQLMTTDLAINQPASEKLSMVYKTFDLDSTRSIETLVMTKDDVENKLEVLKIAIDNAFIRVRNPAEMEITLNDFGSAVNLEVKSRNLDEVLSFIQNHTPTAVPPRAEFGFIASAKVPQDVYVRLSPENQEKVRALGMVDQVGQPYLAVTACLDWLGPYSRPGNNGVPGQFLKPVITITQITSRLQLPSDPILALILADDIFINCGLWEQATRGTPGKPGVANPATLFMKNQNDPSQGNLDISYDEFKKAYPQMIDAPILSLDIGVGRETNDFIYNFVEASCATRVIEVAERVLMDTNRTITSSVVSAGLNSLFAPIGWEYQGIIRYQERNVDSRSLTRLEAVRMGANRTELPLVEALNPFVEDPTARFRAIESLLGSGHFKLLYNVKKMAIVPEFLRALTSAFNRSGMKINDLDNLQRVQQLGMVNTATFDGLGVSPTQFSIFQNPYAFNNQGPSSAWYNPNRGFFGPRF